MTRAYPKDSVPGTLWHERTFPAVVSLSAVGVGRKRQWTTSPATVFCDSRLVWKLPWSEKSSETL